MSTAIEQRDEELFLALTRGPRQVIETAKRALPKLMLLPHELQERASATEDWIQFSCCSREETLEIIRVLGGKWDKEVSQYGDSVDYEREIDGLRYLIHAAPPPSSCRIETVTEVKEVTTRKLVCV